jgi:long-subunit acyl-CoA synthetase (AMP-forming)
MRFLFDSIDREAALRPRSIAISDDSESLSWQDLWNAVANATRWMGRRSSVIGLLAPNGVSYVVAMLAAARAGRTLVPLPLFFSDAQLRKIVKDARVDEIVTVRGYHDRAMQFGATVSTFWINQGTALACATTAGFSLVIYTSGSSGNPKGARHTARQIETVVRGLASASAASCADRYLSLLPLPMLLETICAVFLPIFCGAEAHFAGAAAERIGRGESQGLARVIAAHQPTATVLVPQLLRTLVYELKASDMTSPASLRFVAVGGASIPRKILDIAGQMGIPVYEGYGLSECCSVVALNRPGDHRTGSVGKPLHGITVGIEDGEIVVSGPSVMSGYVDGPAASGVWRTGDLGSIDADGFLTVHGRKDSLIVTSFGRNVSPEWVEAALMADPRIAIAAVASSDGPSLRALLILSALGEHWFKKASTTEVQATVRGLCGALPDYAVPSLIVARSMQEATKAMLVTANGRIIRCRAVAHLDGNLKLAAAE